MSSSDQKPKIRKLLMLNFSLGLLTGILLSIVAVIAGKRFERNINSPYKTSKKAEIVRREDKLNTIFT